MLLTLLALLAGLAMLIKGGDLFVSSSVRIAEFLRLPRVVIGSTLVSLATTSPELVVSIISGLEKEPALAVGNAVGSCICNIGLILGVMALFKHIDVHLAPLKVPFLAMIGTGLLLFFMTLDLRISRGQGLTLILLGAAYFLFDFIRHEREPASTDAAQAAELEQQVMLGHPWLQTRWGTGLQFGCGAVLVLFGSWLLVDSAVKIALHLGIPSIIIGLTVVAIGTSLPEFVTAITSARKNVTDLAIGNILGANVANLTLIIGSAASISDVSMSRQTQLFNFPALLLIVILLYLSMLSDRRISRREGAGLVLFYMGYLAILMVFTVAGKS